MISIYCMCSALIFRFATPFHIGTHQNKPHREGDGEGETP